MKTIDINRIINHMIEVHQRELENLGDLEKLLYIQLLQHYIEDLEIDIISLKIMNEFAEISKQSGPIQPLPHPLPFPEVKPFPYKPSWIVTYGTDE